jgi:hypothetical protein
MAGITRQAAGIREFRRLTGGLEELHPYMSRRLTVRAETEGCPYSLSAIA